MRLTQKSRLRSLSLLAACALALSACAPATPAPTVTPLPTAPAAASATAPEPATATAAAAVSLELSGVAFDSAGSLYLSVCHCRSSNASTGPQLYKLDSSGLLAVFASPNRGGFSGDGGPALSAEINDAVAVALDGDDNVYVADQGNNRIRRIDRQGVITTVAGGGQGGFGGSFVGDGGPAVAAVLIRPQGIVFDAAGSLYIVDAGNNRIRKVDTRGTITTVAGSGVPGFAGDGGPATAANLFFGNKGVFNGVKGIAVDAVGNLYFSDTGNARVRTIDPQGIITTIAGAGLPGFSGDDGPATAAQLDQPSGLALDADGSLYISDAAVIFGSEGRVRKIDPQGIITTVAGGVGGNIIGDGGPATSASLAYPWGLALDAAGNLYIADHGSGRVRQVDRNGIITTVVGGAP